MTNSLPLPLIQIITNNTITIRRYGLVYYAVQTALLNNRSPNQVSALLLSVLTEGFRSLIPQENSGTLTSSGWRPY
jgi:hypothetical protein